MSRRVSVFPSPSLYCQNSPPVRVHSPTGQRQIEPSRPLSSTTGTLPLEFDRPIGEEGRFHHPALVLAEEPDGRAQVAFLDEPGERDPKVFLPLLLSPCPGLCGSGVAISVFRSFGILLVIAGIGVADSK